MYYKIKKYGLSGYGDLQCFIEQEYEKYFRNIYRNHMSTAEIDQMCKNAGRYLKRKGLILQEDIAIKIINLKFQNIMQLVN